MKYLPVTSQEAQAALLAMRAGAPGVVVLTVFTAFFPVVLALFLLLVFDVALPGHSAATLSGITAIFLIFTAVHGFICLLRRRMLGHLADIAAAHLVPRLDDVSARLGEGRETKPGDGLQISRDLDAIQQFFRSSTAIAWLDLAGLPILLLTQIFLAPRFALITLITGGILGFILFRAVGKQEQPARDMVALLASRHSISETSRSSIGTIRALGMRARAMDAWQMANERIAHLLDAGREAMRQSAVIARGLRYAGFALLLMFGGMLAIEDHASAGVVMTGALLGWLGFSPIVGAIETVDIFVAARQGWARLDMALASIQPDPPTLQLPRPEKSLKAEGVVMVVPGGTRPSVQGVRFDLKPGDVMTVIGPGGCGKSVLLRGLAGAWPLAAGKVRLDGAALDQWNGDMLGRHIGYLPQTIDLIAGTVAENIARFDTDPDPERVVSAAHAAMAHDMIVRLPEGYNSQVGPGGNRLSQSQAQRIALARALYGDPFLLILDEPTAHLDGRAEKNMMNVITAARDRGAVVILGGVAAAIIEMASHVLVLRNGAMVEFGEKEEVRKRLASDSGRSGQRKRVVGAANNGEGAQADRAETDTAA